MFEFTAKRSGIARLEFPLIEDGWDGADDPDPEKAEQYLSVWSRVEYPLHLANELSARPFTGFV
jgi:hypothetical protein